MTDPDNLRLPKTPIKDILHRADIQVTPDAVNTARYLIEDALERTAHKVQADLHAQGRKTATGDHIATWWNTP